MYEIILSTLLGYVVLFKHLILMDHSVSARSLCDSFGYEKLLKIAGRRCRSLQLYLTFPLHILIGDVIVSFLHLLGMEAKSVQRWPEAATEFYRARATGHEQFDGGSDIMGDALDNKPVTARYPVQIFTFFVLPLPANV